MGILKKVFGENGLLAKIGCQQRGSHQLVCSALAAGSINALGHPNAHLDQFVVPRHSQHSIKSSQKRHSRHQKRQLRNQEHEACLQSLEAQMLVSLEQMPALKFHLIHGPNAQLSQDQLSARRTSSFCEAIVFSDRHVMPNERVYVRVLDIAKGWNGTIRFGFTNCDPETFRYQPMPKHACPDMTQAGHTWAHALADKLVRRDTIIHFSYSASGYIAYGINQQECGVFAAKVKTSEPLWFVIDIYGLTTAVELLDPRQIHTTSDISRDKYLELSALNHLSSSTTASKRIASRHERRIAKSLAYQHQQQTKMLLDPRSLHNNTGFVNNSNLIGSYDAADYSSLVAPRQPLMTRNFTTSQHQDYQRLPNLNSSWLPPSRQNIYTTMPAYPAAAAATNQQPDYQQLQHYQRLNGNTSNNTERSRTRRSRSASRHDNTTTSHIDQDEPEQNRLQELDQEVDQAAEIADEQEQAAVICRQRMENLDLDGGQQVAQDDSTMAHNYSIYANGNTQLATTPVAIASSAPGLSSSSSSSHGKRTPVAAARRSNTATSGQQHQSTISTNGGNKSTISNNNNKTSTPNNRHQQTKLPVSAQTTRSGAQKHPRPTNNNNNNKTSTTANANNNNSNKINTVSKFNSNARDKENNSPITKDCPICFERPINCVLYQCGHMCTCYECGVKQWRTQSRTCPICRTVIKDVIKTYLS